MWYEYLIIFVCLGSAVAYLLGKIARSFRSQSGNCGSATCRCSGSSGRQEDRHVKVVPLVQLEAPEE